MKKDWEDDYEMREEYDFSKAVRNPFFQEFKDLNLVSLEPDVKAAFPDSDSVNKALREFLHAKQEQTKAA